MARKNLSPNDQRANVKNPLHPDFKKALNNRANQLNPNNPAYHKAREHKSTKTNKK